MKQMELTKLSRSSRSIMLEQLNTKITVWVAITLTFLVSLIAVITRGAAVEWAFLMLTSTIILVSYVVPLIAFKGIEINRTWTTQGLDGANATLHTTIVRKWRLPVVWFATIEAVVNEAEVDAHYIELKQQYIPMLYRKMSQQFKLQQLKRGQYKSEYVTVLVGDIFGLTVLKKDISFPISFSVLPSRLEEQEQTFLSQLTSQKWTSDAKQSIQQSDMKKSEEKQQEQITFSGVDGIRQYSEGDSVHRIYYHAMSRGMGVHILEDKEQLSAIRQVIFIDQYMPPMSTQMYSQQLNTLIGWTLDKVAKELTNGPILIVTDNWCYECYEYYQLDELRRLLSSIKADVQYSIAERLMSLAKLLPSHSKLVVYTTDWKNSEGWTELAQLAWHKKATVSLQLLSEHRIMTYSMREQQREFEQNGLQTIWRFSNLLEKDAQIVREGSEQYAPT